MSAYARALLDGHPAAHVELGLSVLVGTFCWRLAGADIFALWWGFRALHSALCWELPE